MDKPIKKVIEYIDWNEAVAYLEEKYKFDLRDYEGNNTADQDFWHFLCDMCEINNGGFIYFNDNYIDDCKEDWQKTIMGYILSEFGEGLRKECKFKTDW